MLGGLRRGLGLMGNIGGKYRPLRELVLAHDSHIVQTSAFLDRSGLMENHRGGKTGGVAGFR